MTDTAPAAPATETAPAPAAPPADPAALQARDQELNELASRDEPTYRYSQDGALAREHVAIRRALAAAKEPAPLTEQDEGDADDADAIDLELPAEVAEEETGDEGEVGEASSSDEAVAVDSYTPPAIEGVSWADDALKPIIGAAARHGVSEAALTEALSAYGEMIQQQQARINELNATTLRETTKALKAEHGENFKAYREEANEAFKALPKDFRDQLKTARFADGTLLLNSIGAVRLFHRLATAALVARSGQRERQLQGKTEMLKAELAELVALRDRDISEYRRPWKATGISGSDRLLEITRELANEGSAKPSATDLRAEMRELVNLSKSDPKLFAFGSWPGARSPADRLHAIRTGRA